MDAKAILNSDIETLEEKLQILKSKIGEEEYEEIRKDIEEIRKLGVDLPDSGYMASVSGIIKKIVDLEFDNFNSQSLKEAVKEIKREGFLSRLEYIKLRVKEGKDVSKIFSVARQYWNAIKGKYDAFETSEVERKLDEVKLEILLKKVQDSREINLTEIEEINYLLVREKLQNMLSDETISQKKKLLIKSWIGESIDAETGKIDTEFMRILVEERKLWETLTGVKDVQVRETEKRKELKVYQETVKTQIPQETTKIQALMALGNSVKRAQQIIDLSKKYNIPLKKFDFTKKEYEYALYVERYKLFGKIKYRLIGEIKARRLRNKKSNPLNRAVVAVVFNNRVDSVETVDEGNAWRGHRNQPTLEDVVFSDALQSILGEAFYNCGLREVNIPGTVRWIGSSAFGRCVSLRKVSLEKGIKEIGQSAFEGSGLKEINIPSTVHIISNSTFADSQLEKITFENGVIAIGSAAFANTRLKEIELPESVQKLEEEAFESSELEKVVLNPGLVKIGEKCFKNCNLQEIRLPKTVKGIGDSAFSGNPIKRISISKDTAYAKNAFPKNAIIERQDKLGEQVSQSEYIERLEKENRSLKEMNRRLSKKIETLEMQLGYDRFLSR